MNRIYKVIWNKTRGMYMVVSELAKGQSKDGRRAVGRKKVAQTAAALAVFFSIVSMGGTSYAADSVTIGTVEVNDTNGNEQKVLTVTQGDASTIGTTLSQVSTNQNDIATLQTQVSTNTNDIATNKANIETNTNGIAALTTRTQNIIYNNGTTTIEKNLSVQNGLTVGNTVQASGFVTTPVQVTNEYGATTSINQLTISGSTIQGGTATKNVEVNSKNNVSLTAGTRQTNSATVSGGNVINQASYTILNNAGTGIQNNVSGDNGYISNSAAQIKSVASKTITEQITGTDSEGNQAVVNEVQSDANGTTFTNSGSSTTIKGNAISTGSIDATGNISAASVDVSDKLTAGSASVTNSISVGHNANVGGAVNAGSLNSRGNLNVDGNALVKGTLTSQSTINGNEIVSQTNITAKNKVVGMQGVVDNTLTSGNYVTAGNTVGENIVALDTQVKANADQFTTDKTSTALHISSSGDLIVGTKENQTVRDMEIRGKLTSGSISTGNITSSGDVSVAGKVEAEAVYDDTTKTGNYVVQTNSVGANLSALDTQIKSNADAITAEATAREAADTALDTRITNVKEYLEKQTSDNYVSKADAAVQDGAIVKAANTIGENVTNLDAALAKETAARIGADAAQDKVIEQVNQNMVDGFNTINKNMADGFTALNNADLKEAQERTAADAALDDKITAETSARVAADTKLVEAVNSGLSLSDDNVLQKNTTTIDAQGNVTTSKTDANEMILNKGKDNQITLNENGIKVGTNSTVVDKDGVYTGGDTYSEAKAAMSADGSIKGADGKFTVNSANGTVNVNDQIELNGATGVVKSNGLNVGDGNFKVNSSGGVTAAGGKTTLASDGSIKAADGKFTVNSNGGVKVADGKITLSSDGSVKAADGKFTVNSDGGVKAADGKITLSSDGSVKAADGKFTVDSNGAVKAANGNTTIDSNGNLSTMGTVSAANGKFTVDTNGAITSTGLDAGNGTIQTTGTVKAGDVQTGTLETTGDATIGGNLTVDKNLTVNGEFNAKTLSSKLDENNYTTITGGKTQSVNLKMDTATGETKASASTFDETGSNLWAKDDDSIGKSTVTADGISQKLSDTGDNPTAYAESAMSQGTDNKYTMTDTVKDGDKTNVASQSATESSDVITEGSGDSAKTSTFRQKIDQILQEIKSANGSTSVEQTDVNITNTAKNGTITNEAQTLVNKATGDMTNTVGGKMLNDVTGDMENKVGGNLTTTVGGNQTTTVTGDSSLTAENITNEAKNKITNKALDVETDASSSIVSKVSNEYGSNTSTQLSYQTTEEMSQADGKKASYLRGAAEEKSQLTDGDKKTTIDTIAGQTNTNITDGTNTSNSLQKADQVASSVTDGTNTTVVNQDAKSLASSITDGTKANNTNSTVDKSEQLIKASDTQYSATTKTATKTEDALVSGSSVIDVIKSLDDAGSPTISSAVTDGTNSTGITQTAKDITNTAKNGTIANDAKDIINNAAENMTNTVGKDLTTTVGGEMKTTVTGKTTENYNGGLETTITGEEKHTVNGSQINAITGDQTNTIGGSQTTTVTGDSSLSAQNITNTASETLSNSAKNITNTAAEKLSNSAAEIENTASKSITDKVGDNVSRTMTTSQIKESVVDGANSNTSTKTASKDMNIVTDGTSTSTLSQLAGSVNTSLKEVDSSGNSVKSLNNVQTVSEDTTKITDTASGSFSSSSQKADGFTSLVKNNSGGSNTVTDAATKSEQKLVSGNIIDILKDAENGYVNTTVTSSDGASSTSVNQGTADITNTAKQGTITNEAKNLVNTAAESITNTAGTQIQDVVGKSTVTTTDTGTTFKNRDHAAAIGEGSITQTTISGNTLETGKATADYVDVNKDLHVMGNTQLDGTLEVGGKSTFKDDVTMEKDLDVKGTTTTDKLVVNNGANITGGTTTDTLHVTSTATFDGMVTFKDAVSMEKDLTVGGSATVTGDVTAKSYKVGDKTYIDENGINANGQKITNVADGTVAEGSTDAVNGGQLNATNQRVTTVENRMDGVENRMDRVENRVDNLDNRIDKVGASAAAMANLHPMDFDEDSKVSVAAAMGSYRSETAGALGVFYRPTDRVMLNVSTSFGNGENMVGGGVSFKLGKSSKRLEKAEATNATLAKQVTNLQNRLDALLGVLNPSLSKDFPDVPANHWAYEAVSRLAGNNIVQGYEDGKYHGERTMTRYEMAEIIYNALSKGAKAEAKLVEEFRPELQAMAAQRKA